MKTRFLAGAGLAIGLALFSAQSYARDPSSVSVAANGTNSQSQLSAAQTRLLALTRLYVRALDAQLLGATLPPIVIDDGYPVGVPLRLPARLLRNPWLRWPWTAAAAQATWGGYGGYYTHANDPAFRAPPPGYASQSLHNMLEDWLRSVEARLTTAKNEPAASAASTRRPSILVSRQRPGRPDRPQRLSTAELNTTTGAVAWPLLLQADEFATYREALERFFARRAGRVPIRLDEYRTAEQTARGLLDRLREEIKDLPPDEYVAARRFVQSVGYEIRHPASADTHTAATAGRVAR